MHLSKQFPALEAKCAQGKPCLRLKASGTNAGFTITQMHDNFASENVLQTNAVWKGNDKASISSVWIIKSCNIAVGASLSSHNDVLNFQCSAPAQDYRH